MCDRPTNSQMKISMVPSSAREIPTYYAKDMSDVHVGRLNENSLEFNCYIMYCHLHHKLKI